MENTQSAPHPISNEWHQRPDTFSRYMQALEMGGETLENFWREAFEHHPGFNRKTGMHSECLGCAS